MGTEADMPEQAAERVMLGMPGTRIYSNIGNGITVEQSCGYERDTARILIDPQLVDAFCAHLKAVRDAMQ